MKWIPILCNAEQFYAMRNNILCHAESLTQRVYFLNREVFLLLTKIVVRVRLKESSSCQGPTWRIVKTNV